MGEKGEQIYRENFLWAAVVPHLRREIYLGSKGWAIHPERLSGGSFSR